MKSSLTTVGTCCAEHVTRQNLALTSLTSGGSPIDVVRLRSKNNGVCLLDIEPLVRISTTVAYLSIVYTTVNRCQVGAIL
jgi:hypothetical protein